MTKARVERWSWPTIAPILDLQCLSAASSLLQFMCTVNPDAEGKIKAGVQSENVNMRRNVTGSDHGTG